MDAKTQSQVRRDWRICADLRQQAEGAGVHCWEAQGSRQRGLVCIAGKPRAAGRRGWCALLGSPRQQAGPASEKLDVPETMHYFDGLLKQSLL